LPGGVPDVAPPPAAAAPAAPPPVTEPPAAGGPPAVDPAAVIERQHAVDVANAEAKRQADALAHTAAAEHLRREQEIADQVARAHAAAAAQVEKASDYLNEHRDLRDPRESWSTVDRIAAVVAMAFGTLGAGLQSVATGRTEPNQAVAVINQRISSEIERQKENYRRASDAYVRARTGLRDVDDARRTLEDQENARDVAYHKDALAQATELLDKQGVAAADIARDERIIELKKYLEASKEKAIRTQLENDKIRAETEAARARTAAALRKAKGGAGAGGGGAVTGDAVTQLKDFIESGVDGRAATSGEIQAKANELKIPAFAKAGRPSVEAITKSVAFNAERAGKKSAADLKDQAAKLKLQTQIDKEAGAWAKENGIADIAKKQRELDGLLKKLEDNKGNPLQQKLAIENAVSVARGGAASKQALGLALESLGGTLDNAAGTIEHMFSGGIGSKQLQNFMAYINGQLGTAQKEGKDAFDNYGKFVETQPAEKRAGLLAARGQLFSGLHGFGAPAGASHAEQPIGTTKVVKGHTYVKRGANNWELQQ
jgi:hypothetical protein